MNLVKLFPTSPNASPLVGDVYYNVKTSCFNVFDGAQWRETTVKMGKQVIDTAVDKSKIRECVEKFETFGYNENEMMELIVEALGSNESVKLSKLPMEAYLNSDLDIIYKKGKRFPKLEAAIKTYMELQKLL